jgi:hypothetical protein
MVELIEEGRLLKFPPYYFEPGSVNVTGTVELICTWYMGEELYQVQQIRFVPGTPFYSVPGSIQSL